MKRISATIFVLLASGFAGTVSQILSIDSGRLSFGRYQNFDIVELDNGIYLPDPGKPLLPVVSATLVIPAASRVTSVRVQPLVTGQIPDRLNVLPAQCPVPLSRSQIPDFIPPDPGVYSTDTPYPLQLLLNYSIGNAGGFKLVNLLVCPFTYHPLSRKLFLHTRLQVEISFQPAAGIPKTLTRVQYDRLLTSLQPLVLNPEALSKFAPPVIETDQPQIDYLIITSPDLATAFQPYLEYRRARGLRTEIRTTDWIECNYSGRDLPEKIRNHIIDYYRNRGVVYVLLAGDNRQVPSRQIRVDVGNEQGSIPTDLYYGDLDFSWDSNHNNLFGEMEDSIDLYADVFIGRASVENRAQVENFINKVVAFESAPVLDYIRRALLPSGWLWRSLNYHGKFVNDSIAELTPAGWTDLKMENPPDARVVADSFDHGFLIFDPAGHGNEAGVYDENGTPIYTTSFARRQQNHNRYSIMTSLACNPGNFEAEDCLAEVALNCVGGGAIAVMMNSRYGWGTPPVMGPSEKLCVRFYDYLFNRSEYQLGPCHDRSREEFAGLALYSPLWRWCMTEFNLLGDPSIDLWTDIPSPLSITTVDTIATGNQLLSVTVNENSSPVTGVLVTAYKNNEVLTSEITGGNGVAVLNVHPLTPGELRLTATRHNNLSGTKILTVVPGTPEPILVNTSQEIDDWNQPNPNHLLEPGETVRLRITIKNIGTAPATSTRLVLNENHPYITIIDTSSLLGTISPNESVTAENITIAALPEALPGSSPEFTLNIYSDQNCWQKWFSITLGYSGRIWADIDTGVCALSVTARGSIGYDPQLPRQGRGFRYPKNDTSGLYLASFALGNGPEYLVDRFYNLTGLDQDWQLNDSIRTRLPLWNADQLLQASFTDLNHPHPKNIIVDQRAIGLNHSGLNNTVIIIYDLWATGTAEARDVYAGVLADFDVIPTDRLHDLARTLPQLRAVLMRNVSPVSRFFGIKLLYPDTDAHLACIDHAIFVYPESAMTEAMKYRILSGTLGTAVSDRPFNWSVSASTGPFNLSPGQGKQRVAFAFIAAPDSESFLSTCQAVQEWYNNNVGIKEPECTPKLENLNLTVQPAVFTTSTLICYQLHHAGPVRLTVHDITGRTVARLFDATCDAGVHQINWRPVNIAPGIYFITMHAGATQLTVRTLLLK
ncbi:MAG: C25 family cysteine peptidase [candidate division WOR-3 bacterium]